MEEYILSSAKIDKKIKKGSSEYKKFLQEQKEKLSIQRFKGLGEISPDEFGHFIGDNIRLDPVMLDEDKSIEELLSFYMGKNTPDRQQFIIENLKVELDLLNDNSDEWYKW